MFHGPRNTEPKEIYTSDYGLDHRHSQQGYYGNGIYFSDNANYCHNYVHTGSDFVNGNFKSVKQIFLCYVVAGESIKLSKQNLKVPPYKRDFQHNRQTDFIQSDKLTNRDVFNSPTRFDSVENEDRSHLIIYDYNKQYPAYLLSFE
uniref:PARP catalytic domain-containing protein n=1 Tax=Strombidium inclinatum TaxID=197538 RepID=A0A7S3IGC6_9SPIT|mmetsp:Transcript_15724/g.24149  ORF Transcript_15724/g.24149 Transcript_15724/m.24149 type:complete len:146 (+) Transcript_15724:2053-2490(+)